MLYDIDAQSMSMIRLLKTQKYVVQSVIFRPSKITNFDRNFVRNSNFPPHFVQNCEFRFSPEMPNFAISLVFRLKRIRRVANDYWLRIPWLSGPSCSIVRCSSPGGGSYRRRTERSWHATERHRCGFHRGRIQCHRQPSTGRYCSCCGPMTAGWCHSPRLGNCRQRRGAPVAALGAHVRAYVSRTPDNTVHRQFCEFTSF